MNASEGPWLLPGCPFGRDSRIEVVVSGERARCDEARLESDSKLMLIEPGVA